MIVGGKPVPDPDEEIGGEESETRGSGDTRQPGAASESISGDTRGSGDTRQPGSGPA